MAVKYYYCSQAGENTRIETSRINLSIKSGVLIISAFVLAWSSPLNNIADNFSAIIEPKHTNGKYKK